MDIKLKNNRRLPVIIMAAVLLFCSLTMVFVYPVYTEEMQDLIDGNSVNQDNLSMMSDALIEGCYILYNEVYEETDRADILNEYGGDQFDLMRKYMDYEVFNWEGEPLLGTNDKETLADLAKKNDTPYAYRVSFTFQEDSEISDIQIMGSEIDQQIQNTLKQDILNYRINNHQWESIAEPSEVQVVYGMTAENLAVYIENNAYMGTIPVYELTRNGAFIGFIWAFVIILAATAAFFCINKQFAFGRGKIFAVPFEIVSIVLIFLVQAREFAAGIVWITISGELQTYANRFMSPFNDLFLLAVNTVVWLVGFSVLLWCFVCLSAMFTMKKAYWTERSLCVKGVRYLKRGGDDYGEKVKVGAGSIWSRTKRFLKNQYDALLHLDFQDKTNRTIFKIIAINFVVLFIICCFWYYGMLALIIYSVVLFIFLKKYFNNIQNKYKMLLQTTNQLAEGNLDIPIGGDMGIFNPIQEELKKIQNGFKKAVEEEVKSERMKTELITNVSHDLKTPLTAIITYTDLVKNESDEEKRKEYISVLERKSLRLKVLIEDLFEISKASSKNVTMNFMNVDIVDLLKQVGLECDRKIKDANLDFRYSLPEHKVVLALDSQKTYRIFENLITNITKYAMPHTRAYVEMKELDDKVYISMKNISASELAFSTEEITDRFVRGDAARNTEGSGLGLAIAKSFTELQYGSLQISTDADLFKVELTFPKRQQEEVKLEMEQIGLKETL